MNWIRYSIGNTRAINTMPLSIGAPQIQASGPLAGIVEGVVGGALSALSALTGLSSLVGE